MSAPASPASPAPPARQVAFISTPVDVLLVGGLSLLHLAIFMNSEWRAAVGGFLGRVFGPLLSLIATPFYDTPPNVLDAAVVAAMLTWVVNHPHFSATSHRLYRNRASMSQFPVTALGVPVLLVGLLTLALMLPQQVGAWFVKMFLVWSPYHFAAQTLGVTLLYARRAGFEITPRLRRAFSLFIFGTYLGPTLAGEGYRDGAVYFGLTLPKFGLPPDLFLLYKALVILAGIICALLLMREALRQKKRLPLLLVVPALAQYGWFMEGGALHGFIEFVPAYHSLQYLLIAWAINLKERADEGRVPRAPLAAGLESARWLGLNIAGGVFLFALLPWLAGKAFSTNAYAAAGMTMAAVQIHHFFVDGVIWKLRNPRVSQPLMTSLPELTGKVP